MTTRKRKAAATPPASKPPVQPVAVDDRWTPVWPTAMELAGQDARRIRRCPDGSVIVQNNPVQSN